MDNTSPIKTYPEEILDEKSESAEATLQSNESAACEFSDYLKLLKSASKKTKSGVAKMAKQGRFSEAAIAMAWELLFEYFCSISGSALETSELNTLAGIIQKLASGENSTKNLARKICEESSKNALSKETLEDIERRLNLL